MYFLLYVRALGLAILFVLLLIWTALMRLVGKGLYSSWTLLQETTVRIMQHRGKSSFLSVTPLVRRRIDELAGLARLREDKVTLTAADLGGLPGEWVASTEAGQGSPIIYYLHGGGYVMCSPTTHRLLMARLARAAAARVLGVDYRLAPEHPFPAALEDAVRGYRWLLDQGHEPARIFFAGDSAGGGLALATLLRLKEEGDPLPAGVALLSPWVDLAARDSSLDQYARVDYLGPLVEGLGRLSGQYLAGADPRNPLASPIYGDLSGLPPMLLHAGGVEVLLGQVERLARRAEAAGVEVELQVYPHMVHVWHAFHQVFPEAGRAVREIGEFIKRL